MLINVGDPCQWTYLKNLNKKKPLIKHMWKELKYTKALFVKGDPKQTPPILRCHHGPPLVESLSLWLAAAFFLLFFFASKWRLSVKRNRTNNYDFYHFFCLATESFQKQFIFEFQNFNASFWRKYWQ